MIRKYIGALLTVLFISFMVPLSASAFDVYGDDPAPGTAEKYIEDAIAEGMKLVEKSDYSWGGGRNESTYGKLMDCSSFMHYIFNKGSGLLLVNDNPKHAGDGKGKPAVTTVTLQSNMDVQKNVKIKDLKRGDMIFFTGHVGLYLGDGVFLNDAGRPDKPTPGVSIGDLKSDYWSGKYNGNVVRVKEGGKGVTVRDGATIDTSIEEGNEEKGKGEKSGKTGGATNKFAKGLEKFMERTEVQNSVGVKDNQEVLGADHRNFIYDISKRGYDLLIKVGVILSYALVGYTSIMVVFYLVLATRGGSNKTLQRFEKLTGVEAEYSKEATKNILIRWSLSIVLMCLFLLGSYVDLMNVFYTLVEKVWIF